MHVIHGNDSLVFTCTCNYLCSGLFSKHTLIVNVITKSDFQFVIMFGLISRLLIKSGYLNWFFSGESPWFHLGHAPLLRDRGVCLFLVTAV